MPKHDVELVRQYYKTHAGITSWDMYVWTHLADLTDHANRITFAYEDWLQTDRSTPPPDLVEWVALYGYIRLRLKTWKLPVVLTPEETEHWRASGYFMTKDDFVDALAIVATGIFYTAGLEPQLTAQIMQRQLEEKLAELDRLANLPIDTTYAPEFQEWQVRERYYKEGLRGAQLEDAVSLIVLDEDRDIEIRRFKLPFDLRDQLESFEYGMEMLRLIMLGETSEEANLPNPTLFDAWMQINLNKLLARLSATNAPLEAILRNLAKYRDNVIQLRREWEPERFWWHHRTTAKPPRHRS